MRSVSYIRKVGDASSQNFLLYIILTSLLLDVHATRLNPVSMNFLGLTRYMGLPAALRLCIR
jgi:hypothetical protein